MLKLLVAVWTFTITTPDGASTRHVVRSQQQYLTPSTCDVRARSFERAAKRLEQQIGAAGKLDSKVTCEPTHLGRDI